MEARVSDQGRENLSESTDTVFMGADVLVSTSKMGKRKMEI